MSIVVVLVFFAHGGAQTHARAINLAYAPLTRGWRCWSATSEVSGRPSGLPIFPSNDDARWTESIDGNDMVGGPMNDRQHLSIMY